jgi:hypothetical protein
MCLCSEKEGFVRKRVCAGLKENWINGVLVELIGLKDKNG